MDIRAVDALIKEQKDSLGGTLSVLTGIQAKYGYLPEAALRRVAEATDHPLTDIYAVATFYRAFSLKPRGKHVVSVCLGTACHVRGASKIIEEFSAQLGIKPGETTVDKKFTLETVNCLGACALGPTVMLDGRYFSHVSVAGVRNIINQVRAGRQRLGADDERLIPLSVQCPLCGASLMNKKKHLDGKKSIRLGFACEGKKGTVYLSSLYGSGCVRCDCGIADGTLTELSCPRCGKKLKSSIDCPECGAAMAMMSADGRAMLHVCTRKGCPGHRLDLITVTKRAAKKGKKTS